MPGSGCSALHGVNPIFFKKKKNSYLNSYMDILEKAKLTTLIRHAVRFLKSEEPIYNPEVPDTAGRKTRRRRKYRQLQSVLH